MLDINWVSNALLNVNTMINGKDMYNNKKSGTLNRYVSPLLSIATGFMPADKPMQLLVGYTIDKVQEQQLTGK